MTRHSVRRKTKLQLYKALVQLIVTYASESWTPRKKILGNLYMFERNPLRKIIGPIRKVSGRERQGNNQESYELKKEEYITI